jgi:hypothetical protein
MWSKDNKLFDICPYSKTEVCLCPDINYTTLRTFHGRPILFFGFPFIFRKKISIISGHTASSSLSGCGGITSFTGLSSTSRLTNTDESCQAAAAAAGPAVTAVVTGQHLPTAATSAVTEAAEKLTRQKKKRRKRKNIVSAKLG